MRKAIWIPACLVLFLFGDRLGGWMLSEISTKSQFRYTRLYQGKAEADILLLGNSRGLIFYQPYIEKITGKRTLNLSYNSMPIDLGRAIIEDYLDQYRAPELLLIDITMCDRINNQLIAGFSTFSPFSDRLNELIKEKSAKSWYAGKLSHLYRYNSEVFQRTLFYLTKSDEDWLNDRLISTTMQQNIDEEDIVELQTDQYLLSELELLIKNAEKKGVMAALVANPYYPGYIDKMHQFYKFIGKIEAKTNKKVKDYSRALQEVSGFADYQHLNKQGSRQYLDLLLRDGILSKK